MNTTVKCSVCGKEMEIVKVDLHTGGKSIIDEKVQEISVVPVVKPCCANYSKIVPSEKLRHGLPVNFEHKVTLEQITTAMKAANNIEKWGVQDLETIGLAIAEETGELCQAILQAKSEGGDPARIMEEARDLAALCLQIVFSYDAQYTPEES